MTGTRRASLHNADANEAAMRQPLEPDRKISGAQVKSLREFLRKSRALAEKVRLNKIFNRETRDLAEDVLSCVHLEEIGVRELPARTTAPESQPTETQQETDLP